jgi:hypothetical protein
MNPKPNHIIHANTGLIRENLIIIAVYDIWFEAINIAGEVFKFSYSHTRYTFIDSFEYETDHE